MHRLIKKVIIIIINNKKNINDNLSHLYFVREKRIQNRWREGYLNHQDCLFKNF